MVGDVFFHVSICFRLNTGILCIVGVGNTTGAYQAVSAVICKCAHYTVHRTIDHVSVCVVTQCLPVVGQQTVVCIVGHGGTDQTADAFLRISGLCTLYGGDIAVAVVAVSILGQDLLALHILLLYQKSRRIIGAELLRSIGANGVGQVSFGVILVGGYVTLCIRYRMKRTVLVVGVADDFPARVGQGQQVPQFVVGVLNRIAPVIGVFCYPV